MTRQNLFYAEFKKTFYFYKEKKSIDNLITPLITFQSAFYRFLFPLVLVTHTNEQVIQVK